MTIEELLKEIKDEKVEYKKLNEATDMKRGTSLTKQTAVTKYRQYVCSIATT